MRIPVAYTFDTRAEAMAEVIPSVVGTFETLGYGAAGDGGRALWVRADTEPLHEGKLQSADGAWWKLAQQRIDARMFGVVADANATGSTGTDSIAELQAAADYVMYFSPLPGLPCGERVLDVPAGNIRITDTLHLGYGVGSQYTSITLNCAGLRYDPAQFTQAGTAIIGDFDDRMIVNIQGSRYPRLKGVTIVGQYTHITSAGLGYAFNDNDWNEDEWKDGTWAASAFAPKSIYAGITVDAYSGPEPPTHYPYPNYPPWLGTVQFYGKAMSTDVLLEDVGVINCVAAIAGHPCTSPGNGEFIRWRGGFSRGCLYGYTLGHSQGRLATVERVDFSQFYTAIDNTVVGDQHGMMHGTFQNCHFGGGWQILRVLTGFGNPVALRDCYGEMIGRFGDVWAVGDGMGAVADNCVLDMREISDERYGVPASHAAGSDNRLSLIGNTKIGVRYAFITEFGGNAPVLHLDGAQIVMANVVSDGLPAAFEFGCGGVLSSTEEVDCQHVRYRADGQFKKVTQRHWTGTYAPHYARSYTFDILHDSARGAQRRYELPDIALRGYMGANVTLANRNGRNVDIAVANARLAYKADAVIPVDLGDAKKIADAWFVVVGFDTDTVHLRQISNYRLTAVGSAFVDKSQADATDAHVNAVFFSRVFAPHWNTQLLAGAVTNASAVITNVKRALAASDTWDNATGPAANDWLMLSEMPEAANVGGNSHNRLQRLTALDTTAKTMTFANAFPFAKSPAYLPFWIKTLTP